MTAPDYATTRMRLAVVGVVCVALFASLFVRLYYLQVITTTEYQVAAKAVHLRTIHRQGPRGRILDRNGKVLVDNKTAIVVGIDKRIAREQGLGDGDPKTKDAPAAESKRRKVFRDLAVVLTSYGFRTKAPNIERLYEDPRYGPNDFLPIADSGVYKELQLYLGERSDRFPGVVAENRTFRVYPYGSLAAHVLGYVGRIVPAELTAKQSEEGTPAKPKSADSKPYSGEDEIGKSGIERSFESYLRGKPGDTVIQVDARGNEVGVVKEPQLAAGDDVWLSIDVDQQALTEQQLAAVIASRNPSVSCDKTTKCNAHTGAAVILDPRNGEVRSMASYPTFDPSELVNGISSDKWAMLNDKSTKRMLNRAIAESYAPGSTFKLVTTHAGVEHGVINRDQVVGDPGYYDLQNCSGKCRFYNAGKEILGASNLRRAITVSSDVYFYRVADLLSRGAAQYGPTPIQDSARLFGFGIPTGIDLPAESAGLIGTPQWLKSMYNPAHPNAFDHYDWKIGDTINVAIGQGLVAVTPLQLANAYAGFANGGTRYVPQIVTKITRRKDLSKPVDDLTNIDVVKTFEPRIAGTVAFADPNNYTAVYDGLLGVTSKNAGTASGAFDKNPTAWPMAGKTGTAQVSRKADTSVFVGWGPAAQGQPAQYAMAAVLPESGFGADAAAPTAFSTLSPISRGQVAPAVPAPQSPVPLSPPTTVPPPTTTPRSSTTVPKAGAAPKSGAVPKAGTTIKSAGATQRTTTTVARPTTTRPKGSH